jgi:hypothetical protein
MDEQTDRPVLACNLTAIETGQRQGHQALAEGLLGPAAQEIVDRPDGYALRFAADDYAAITRFVDNERRCCPFLRFALDVAPEGGPIWLRITGPEGAKAVLRAAVGWQGR